MSHDAILLIAPEDWPLAFRLTKELARAFDVDVAILEPPWPDGRLPWMFFERQYRDSPDIVFVVLWTRRARASESFLELIDAAVKFNRTVIPCVIGGVPRETLLETMPAGLRRFQHLDLGASEETFDERALELLARYIMEHGPPFRRQTAARPTLALRAPVLATTLLFFGVLFLLATFYLRESAGPASSAWEGFAALLRSAVTPSRLLTAGLMLCYVGLMLTAARHLFEFNVAWLIAKNLGRPAEQIRVQPVPLWATATGVALAVSSLFVFVNTMPVGKAELTGPERGEGRLAGRLTDADGRPIFGATVVVLGGPARSTDDRGRFLLNQVPTGERLIAVEMPSGSVLKSRPIHISQSRLTSFNLIHLAGTSKLGLFSITEPAADTDVVIAPDESPLNEIRVSGYCAGLSEMVGDFDVWVLVRPESDERFWVQHPAAVIDPERDTWRVDIRLDPERPPVPRERWEIVAVAARRDSGIERLSNTPTLEMLPRHLSSNETVISFVYDDDDQTARGAR